MQTKHILEDITGLDSRILIDDSEKLWLHVKHLEERSSRELSIVMDNSGLEMFADLCFAIYCLSHKLFDTVKLYVKKIPWFVSDVTPIDIEWAIQQMKSFRDCSGDNSKLKMFAEKCLVYLDSDQLQILAEGFWTLPLPYHVMPEKDPKLFHTLGQSQLIIFKG